MGDQGTLAQSAIGGYELATGSKPALHCLHVTGTWTNGHDIFINGEGTTSGDDTGFSVVFGAGSITLGTVAAKGSPVEVVFGAGDDKDDLDIVGAYGSIAWDDGGGSTYDTAGSVSVKSIDGGTVNLLVSMHDPDDGTAVTPVSGTDSYRLIVYAHARSNL
tara:strand:+ start:188 stop:670 length:483 start_codon:yes stop_codon:yes gene_type:complete